MTQPDRPAGRGHKLTATPVKRAAEARGLHVLTPLKLKSFVDDARSLGPDAFVVASYGKIVPQALLDVVPIAFNVHPSLLPLYRGATPLQSAVRDGRTETGVTIIAMDSGMDTGDVLLQERTPLGADETYGMLHDRLATRGAQLAVDALERYANGTLERRPQADVARALGLSDDAVAATATRPLRKEDLAIDWSRLPEDVARLVRSLSPAPLARTSYLDEAIKIVAAHAVSIPELQALLSPHAMWQGGGVMVSGLWKRELIYGVQVADPPAGAVVIDEVISPNRGRVTGPAYARMRLAQVRARIDAAAEL